MTRPRQHDTVGVSLPRGEAAMIRSVLTLLAASVLACCLSDRATAQPFPVAIQVVDAKAEKGKMTWTETVLVPLNEEYLVEVEINGVKVQQRRTRTVMKPTTVTKEAELKKLYATDANGKAIAADKLAELLKESTPVVFVSGPLPEKHRALFKDKVVFIVALSLPTGPVQPAPPVVTVPPVVEKKQ